MKVVALRLKPTQDLKVELQKFIDANKIQAACVLTCVGSLQKAKIRFANQENYTDMEGKFEIVSLVGMFSVNGSHVHISVSDSTGKTLGGHISEGNLIYTTAEILLGIMPEYNFKREDDPESGYKELKITKPD
ncbi:MAG: DNA-binding protein [Verrucomicrobia bacterium]|nr:DNA-binding protein [Cytophagales bacterium]